jgi:hypothetical protein
MAAPVLRRLGALAVTIYACGLAGILLLAAAVASSAGGAPILRTPSATQLAALCYLAVAVTAVVFLAWYAAMQRLGVNRTGLFNGLIPIASLAAVALTGTGTITPLQFPAALSVLAGVILGLGHTPQVPAGAVNQAGQRRQPGAETTPVSPRSERAPAPSAMTHERGRASGDPGPLALRPGLLHGFLVRRARSLTALVVRVGADARS